MGILHRNYGDSEAALHPPGFVSADDPASTYGTGTTGVRSGQFWIEHASGDADDIITIKVRNDANTDWVDVFESWTSNLPTTDPARAGAPWNSSGVLAISSG